ncbi:hypothetical protein ACRS6Y_19140 [Bacillus cytotoxicus]|uniref:Small, acid-soluble spore protein N n=2 Tax=Bacillus cytotoxicus TaxID=580165 RepID=A0AAX2CI37_9BACI|nr:MULTISPECIES: hypothetical protein [Bacillus cereus group]ABS22516.1 conserved hypothetical protein [Bacillus cytotoxicus NVH 391-98]AWC29175.1 hypothetical protein CG483_013100 [Bacillus cytotoxicus]AWC33161.1 hypothetical protein CG482_012705 [Bacillus cytotoxicus]AWC37186.1 hypothetical protein CG481_012720 [Bacillus cytotoxicus]AWC41300.1 hypothetical protein CG480_013100 [Bacillus cytotoxicus]
MPYHKDKQQAFQAAQQGVVQAEHIFNNIVKNDPNYGHDLKQLHQEVQEAYEQIQNALEVASETQRPQLKQYESHLQNIMREVDQLEK